MSKNKVLLINSNLIKPPVAPIALDYIGSCLEVNGFSIELLDLNFSEDISRDIKDRLKNETFIAIGVTIRNTDDCYFLSQMDFIPAIRDIIKQIKMQSGSPVVIGGGGFSIMPVDIIDEVGADHGVVGDGELAFLEILRSLLKNERTKKIIKADMKTLKDFPVESRDIVDNFRYFFEGGMGSIETRRGCDRKCIYCADPVIKGGMLRTRHIKTVISEINNLLKKGIDVIHFCDSEFNIPINYSREILRAMIDNKIGKRLKWYAYMSPEYIDEEYTILLKESGCEGIDFGIDSASPEIIRNLGRRHSLEDLFNISELFKKHDMRFMFDLLLGGPGENKDTIKETINNVKRLDPTCVGISYGIRVYPGTRIAGFLKGENGSFFDDNTSGRKILHGRSKENNNFTKPVFYFSPEIGEAIISYTNELVDEDERFFIGATENEQKNYNYNENARLQEAIDRGYRGAYWDILRQIR